MTEASASTVGSYTVASYTSGIASGSSYNIPKIWYPTNGTPPYASVVFIPGLDDSYTEGAYTVQVNGQSVVEYDITEWATFLASHGFVVMFINPSDLSVGPSNRSTSLSDATNALVAENTRSASPLYGKLLVNKIAVSGHSYGGAGALLLANAGTNSHVAAALGLSPVPNVSNPYSSDLLPSMIISGVGDPYMSDYPGQYNSFPASTTKLLANFKQSSEWSSMHDVAMVPLGTHSTDPEVARLGLSFLEVYLYGDTRYKTFLVNDATNMANFYYANP